jgi:hypothetical protein
MFKLKTLRPRDFSSVGKDNALYMQGLEFEPQPPQKKKKNSRPYGGLCEFKVVIFNPSMTKTKIYLSPFVF